MNIVQLLVIAIGMLACVALLWTAFTGPSPAKEVARRLQTVRFRHSENAVDKVEAQLRKAVAARKPKDHDDHFSAYARDLEQTQWRAYRLAAPAAPGAPRKRRRTP